MHDARFIAEGAPVARWIGLFNGRHGRPNSTHANKNVHNLIRRIRVELCLAFCEDNRQTIVSKYKYVFNPMSRPRD